MINCTSIQLATNSIASQHVGRQRRESYIGDGGVVAVPLEKAEVVDGSRGEPHGNSNM